jgi:molecular chaperone DnaK (HSP70)
LFPGSFSITKTSKEIALHFGRSVPQKATPHTTRFIHEIIMNDRSIDNDEDDYWIGIDWGTTNCTAAIYCPFFGRSKWMRLSFLSKGTSDDVVTHPNDVVVLHDLTEPQPSNHKIGRIVPSVFIFATTQFLDENTCHLASSLSSQKDDKDIRIVRLNYSDSQTSTAKMKQNYYIWQNIVDLLLPFETQSLPYHQNDLRKLGLWVCVGAAAESFIAELLLFIQTRQPWIIPNTTDPPLEEVSTTSPSIASMTEDDVDSATIRSVKRTILKELSTIPLNHMDKNKAIHIPIRPLGCSYYKDQGKNSKQQNQYHFDAITIAAIMLQSIRRAAQNYLQQPKVQKKLGLPVVETATKTKSKSPLPSIRSPLRFSCCIGVPVVSSLYYRTLIQMAGTRAGYRTTICITESTAAAIAYGLSFVVLTPTSSSQTSTQNNTITTSTSTNNTTLLPPSNNSTDDTSVNDETAIPSSLSSNSQEHQDQAVERKQTIFVFDMGGGTTDVTIAERNLVPTPSLNTDDGDDTDIDFHVCVTVGNDQLGGDDMDQAIMNLVQNKMYDPKKLEQTSANNSILQTQMRQQLLRQCRIAKLALCGDIDHDIRPLDSYVVSILDHTNPDTKRTKLLSITISQNEFELALVPSIQSTRDLIESALEQYNMKRRTADHALQDSPSKTNAQYIDEVILIGGASRVPYVRQLLRDIFISKNEPDSSTKELCTSINAMSAVAQGCSVSAMIYSGRVPIHEIKSAYMLDTIPYSIGVLTSANARPTIHDDISQSDTDTIENDGENVLSDQNYIEILSRGESLPAAGYSTFVLSDMLQKGITVVAVEQIPISSSSSSSLLTSERHTRNSPQYHYNVIGEFTFLLHRLSKEQIQRLKDHEMNIRTVDVGMTLKESGEFVVSIFDQNDPDHIRKKQWYQRNLPKDTKNRKSTTPTPNNNTAAGTLDSEPMTYEQMVLMVSCLVVFVLYIVTKMTFPASTLMMMEVEDPSSV